MVQIKKDKKKQKQRQKQKVNVSQNVKVVVGEIKRKRVSRPRGKPSQPSQPSQEQKKSGQNISLNIVNPLNPFNPFVPSQQSQAQLQAQAQSKAQSDAQAKQLRSLGFIANQNQIIQGQLRDLNELKQGQHHIYNALLEAQKQKENPENVVQPVKVSSGTDPMIIKDPTKLSKVERAIKTKGIIISSINWKSLIENEPKLEKKTIEQSIHAPSVYQFMSPRPTAQQYRESQERQEGVNREIITGMLGQARANIAERKRQEKIKQQGIENIARQAQEREIGALSDYLAEQAINESMDELMQEDKQQREGELNYVKSLSGGVAEQTMRESLGAIQKIQSQKQQEQYAELLKSSSGRSSPSSLSVSSISTGETYVPPYQEEEVLEEEKQKVKKPKIKKQKLVMIEEDKPLEQQQEEPSKIKKPKRKQKLVMIEEEKQGGAGMSAMASAGGAGAGAITGIGKRRGRPSSSFPMPSQSSTRADLLDLLSEYSDSDINRGLTGATLTAYMKKIGLRTHDVNSSNPMNVARQRENLLAEINKYRRIMGK